MSANYTLFGNGMFILCIHDANRVVQVVNSVFPSIPCFVLFEFCLPILLLALYNISANISENDINMKSVAVLLL